MTNARIGFSMFLGALSLVAAGAAMARTEAQQQTPVDEPEAARRVAQDMLSRFDTGDPDWKVRMECLVRLVKAGAAVVPVLVEALENVSVETRVFAAQALAIFADTSSQPALLNALGDASPQVRIYAVRALSMMERLEPTGEVYRLLERDPEWEVRSALAWAVERDDMQAAVRGIRKELAQYDLAWMDTARLDEPAPEFSLTDPTGNTFRLSDFRDKKALVLVFFLEGL